MVKMRCTGTDGVVYQNQRHHTDYGKEGGRGGGCCNTQLTTPACDMVTDTALDCSPYCPPPAINEKATATRVVWHRPNTYVSILSNCYATPSPVERAVRAEHPNGVLPSVQIHSIQTGVGPAWVELVLVLKLHSPPTIESKAPSNAASSSTANSTACTTCHPGAPHRNGVGGVTV